MQTSSGESLSRVKRLAIAAFSRRIEWFILTAIIGLGILLRWSSPAMRSDFWYDEMYSYMIARQPFAEMVHSLLLGGDASPPLYTFVLHFWLKLGDSDTQAKLLSLIFGTAAIPAMYLLAKRISGLRVGLLAALLLATSQAAINYSAEARAYAIFLCLSLLSTYFLLSLVDKAAAQDPIPFKRFAGFIAITTLVIYTHWFGLLLVAVQATAMVIYYRDARRVIRQYVLSLLAIGVCCLPLTVFLWNQIARREAAGGFLWPGRPGLRSLYELAAFLFGGQNLLVLAAVIFALAYFSKPTPPRRAEMNFKRHLIFFSGYFVLPIAVVFAMSRLLARYSFFVPRYFLPFSAGAMILIALTMVRIQRRIALVCALMFVFSPVVKFIKHWQQPETPYSQLAATLPAGAGGDSLVVHLSPMSYYPTRHYQQTDGANEKVLWSREVKTSFPLRINLAGGLLRPNELLEVGALDAYDDLWVVVDSIDQDKSVQALEATLRNDGRFSLTSEQRFAGLRLEHFTLSENQARLGAWKQFTQQGSAAKDFER